jgi:hypothetical protein
VVKVMARVRVRVRVRVKINVKVVRLNSTIALDIWC